MPTIMLYGLVFVLLFAVCGIVSFRIISARRKNGRLPRTTMATVSAKRGHTSRDPYCKTCQVQPSEISTSYYVTFQFESGDRLELHVPAEVHGQLREGDRGRLTFQGHVFLGFERT